MALEVRKVNVIMMLLSVTAYQILRILQSPCSDIHGIYYCILFKMRNGQEIRKAPVWMAKSFPDMN